MAYQSLSKKWCCFENIQPSHAKRFVCCTLTIWYVIYSMVGQSISSISDLGDVFTSALCALVNIVPRVRYVGNDLPTILYIIHMVW